MGQTNGALVVTKYRRGGLGITNILKGRTEKTRSLSIAKSSGELSFSSRGYNNRDTGGEVLDSSIIEGGVMVTKGMVAAGFGAGLGEAEIGGVGLALE